MHAAKRTWLPTVQRYAVQEYGTPGLLQLVVRWGRDDIAQLVFQDEELKDQRQPRHVQRAFQDALERAMEPSFDPSLVETLLSHGAEAANIFLPDLFKNIRNDSFGFCQELRDKRYDSRARKASAGRGGGGGSGDGGGGGHSPRNASQSADGSPITSPWQDRHIQLMTQALQVKGFDDYARRQPVVRSTDLMCWAIAVGSLDLARLMWQRTKSPLRAGLLVQAMCTSIQNTRHVREEELEEAKKRFSEETVGVLDHLNDQEEARKLLTGRHGEFSTLGTRGSATCDILELAISLGNRTFVAHRHCQSILDEQWYGRHPDCGMVKFGSGRWAGFVPPLESNDLHPAIIRFKSELAAQDARSAQRTLVVVPPLRAYLIELWKIPIAKRHTQLVSMLGFVLSFCSVCFQPLCGPVNGWHYIFVGYLGSNVVQEFHQVFQDTLYAANAFNSLDIFIIFLLILACRHTGGSNASTNPSTSHVLPADKPLCSLHLA